MKTNSRFRLAESTLLLPLINQWPAWSYLVSPVTASLYLANYQLKIMHSYLEDPAAHFEAHKNPELESGPFMNICPSRRGEVRALMDKSQRRPSLALANALISFTNRLEKETKGTSLERLYRELPESLRGRVELVYDYHDHPSIRVLEPLFFDSEFYDPTLESYRIAQVQTDRSRSFILNTPCLPEPDEIDWNVPFSSASCDELFRLDKEPQSLGRIIELLGNSVDADRILPFLSDQPVSFSDRWTEKTVRIRHIGHACVLVEWNGVSILTDPCIPLHPLGGGEARFSYGDLPEKIDFALITHNHQDHYVFETLLRLRHRIECLVVPRSYGILYGDISLKLLSQKLGFRNVMEMETLDSIPFPGGAIVGVPFFGEHGDLAHGKTAYVVRCGGEQILFAADSDCLDPGIYRNIREAIGPVRTTFLSVENVGAPLSWVNGPLLPQTPAPHIDQDRRYHACDAERALALLEALGSKRLFVYAMGLEPWMRHLLGMTVGPGSEPWAQSERVLAACRGRGFWSAERLIGKNTRFLSCQNDAAGSHPSVRPAMQAPSLESRHQFWEHFDEFEHARLEVAPTFSTESEPQEIAIDVSMDQLWSRRTLPPTDSSELAALITSALASSFALWTGQQHLMVVLCLNGRQSENHHAGQRDLVLPLRLDISGEPTFGELVNRVEQGLAAADLHALESPVLLSLARKHFGAHQPPAIRIGVAIDLTGDCRDHDSGSFSQWQEMTDFGIVVCGGKEKPSEIVVSCRSRLINMALNRRMVDAFLEALRSGSGEPNRLVSEILAQAEKHVSRTGEDLEAQFSF